MANNASATPGGRRRTHAAWTVVVRISVSPTLADGQMLNNRGFAVESGLPVGITAQPQIPGLGEES